MPGGVAIDPYESKTFHQTIEFPGVTVAELFRTYLTSKEHSAALGAPATVSDKVGGKFRIFGDNGVKGTNLAIVPERQIVQAWRGQVWQEDDLDSVVVLTFEATARGAKLHLAHVNVPDNAYEMVNENAWNQLYWRPWKEYFAAKKPASKKR